MDTPIRQEAPLWRLAIYAIPATGLAMLAAPIVVFLPNFYAAEAGISLTSVGAIFFLARLWDGASDLVVGLLSDRTNWRWGRHVPWMLFATPPLCLAAYAVCMPPPGAGPVYLLLALVSVYGAWTAVQIPYAAWGAAISSDFKVRSRVFGLREIAAVVGSIASVLMPFAITGTPSPPLGEVVAIVGLGAAAWIALTVPLALAFGPGAQHEPPASAGAATSIRLLGRNGPFLRVILVTLFATTGLMVFTAGVLFYLNLALALSAVFLQLLLVQQVATMLSVPLVFRLAARFGRHRVLSAGCGVVVLGLGGLAASPHGGVAATGAALILIGCGAGAVFSLVPAMAADAIDYGALRRRGAQAGLYMSALSLMTKIATALGVGIALPALQWRGFDPEAVIGPDGVGALREVVLFLPCGLLTIAAGLAWTHPFDRRRHDVVLARLRTLQSRQGNRGQTPGVVADTAP